MDWPGVLSEHKDRTTVYNPLGDNLPDELQVNVVEVLELHPPKGETAVHWILVTSLPVATLAEQLKVIRVYRLRWTIEEFFRALKQGCKYEQRQLESAAALLNALALFLPVAWHLLCLRTVVATAPDAQWRKLFAPAVVTAVRRLAPKLKLTAAATVKQVYLGIAYLGGHLPRNGMPGWQTLTKGWAQVVTALQALGAKTDFSVAINA